MGISATRPAARSPLRRIPFALVLSLTLAACRRGGAPSAPTPTATSATAPAPEPEPDRATALAGLPPAPPELGALVVTRPDLGTSGNAGLRSIGLLSLVDAPGSLRVVGHVERGAKVTRDAVEVQVRPNPARVLRDWTLSDGRAVKAGDVVWVLDQDGVRNSWVWWNGATTSELMFPAWDTRTTRVRNFWAIANSPVPRQDWTHVTAATGQSGWLDTTEFPLMLPDETAMSTTGGEATAQSGAKASARVEERLAPPAQLGAVYVARDLCPFECCHFGEVTARASLALVVAPQSERIVADVLRGEVVTAEGDEVHVVPRAVRLRSALPLEEFNEEGTESRTVMAARGEIVWLLASIGEGYVQVWRDGRIYDADSPEQWSDPVGAPVDDDFHWWVRVRTKSGVVGWFDNTLDLFTGFDGCA